MEILIGVLVIAGLGYLLWQANQPKPKASQPETPAPYKVEAPVVQESAPAAAPAKEVTSETASKPAKAPKKPRAKPATVEKKPAAMKAPKKPRAKKATK